MICSFLVVMDVVVSIAAWYLSRSMLLAASLRYLFMHILCLLPFSFPITTRSTTASRIVARAIAERERKA